MDFGTVLSINLCLPRLRCRRENKPISTELVVRYSVGSMRYESNCGESTDRTMTGINSSLPYCTSRSTRYCMATISTVHIILYDATRRQSFLLPSKYFDRIMDLYRSEWQGRHSMKQHGEYCTYSTVFRCQAYYSTYERHRPAHRRPCFLSLYPL